MDKALTEGGRSAPTKGIQAQNLRNRMSDHIAFALLVYTGLHIFVTMGALHNGGGSILPYFALIVLVAAIIPACHALERRWDGLTKGQPDNSVLARQFQIDRGLLWVAAIGLPFLLTGMVLGLRQLI